MKSYDLKRASFLASSWGGGHVLCFCLKHPEMVDRLVLSSPCGINHKMPSVDRLLAIPLLGHISLLFTSRRLVRSQLMQVVHRTEVVDQNQVEAVYRPFFAPGAIRCVVNGYRNADFGSVEQNLERVTCPVLLVWGKYDKVHGQRMMEEMNRRIPGSRLLIFEQSGHLPHEEEPERFNREAVEFLGM